MRFIPTPLHAVLDYLTAIFFLGTPWIFGLKPGDVEVMIFMVLGITLLTYSVFTKYELGLVRVLPLKTHLTLDILSGMLLSGSPWLFNFVDGVYLPHLLIGVFEIALGIFTRTKILKK